MSLISLLGFSLQEMIFNGNKKIITRIAHELCIVFCFVFMNNKMEKKNKIGKGKDIYKFIIFFKYYTTYCTIHLYIFKGAEKTHTHTQTLKIKIRTRKTRDVEI